MKLPERRLIWLALALALVVLAEAGCGGINASGSASPATFFLPGLMKADPPRERLDPATPAPAPVTEIALVR